jgi:hypothetical protein
MTCDLATVDDDLADIMRNKEVIGVNQDFVDNVGMRVTSPLSPYGEVWAKRMSGGRFAAFVRGQVSPSRNYTVFFQDVGLHATDTARVRDVSRAKDRGMHTGSFSVELPLDESVLLVFQRISNSPSQLKHVHESVVTISV